jgi:membrane protease YdiL (CAAX protease family)
MVTDVPRPQFAAPQPEEPPAGRPPSSRWGSVFFGRREIRAGWGLLIYGVLLCGCFWGLLQATRALLRAFHVHFGDHPPGVESAEGLLLGQSLLLLSAFIALAVMGRLEARSFASYGIPWTGALGPMFWRGAVWGLVVFSGAILLLWAAGGYSFGGFALADGRLLGYALLWAVIAVVNGLGENLALLGYPLFTLSRGLGFWPATLLMSGLFAAGHYNNPGESAVGLASILLQGVFLCFTVRRTGGLWFSVGLHAGGIFAEDFLLSVPDSGTVFTGHLLHASLQGPPWLTGGTVGPEGSVVTLAVFVLAFAAFALVYRGTRS